MDIRSERTVRALQDALLSLAREHPFDAITVSDIVARAEVNRSTFYQHYPDKQTLLLAALDTVAEAVGATLPDEVPPHNQPPVALISYLEHLRDNADLYRRVLGDHGSAAVAAHLRARIRSLVTDALAHTGSPGFPGMPTDILASGLTGSALGVIEAWIARDPLPPVETAVDWVWSLLVGPVGRLSQEREAAARSVNE